MPISSANDAVSGLSRTTLGSESGSTIQSRPRARTNEPGENLLVMSLLSRTFYALSVEGYC
jgi:hypothetical protein